MTKKIFENYFQQNLKEKNSKLKGDELPPYMEDAEAEYYKKYGNLELPDNSGENKFEPGLLNKDQDFFDFKYPLSPDLMPDEEKKIVKKIVPGDEIYNKLKSSIDKKTVKQAKAKRMNLYIVLYGKMGGDPELDFKRPVLLELYAADQFYLFLKQWPKNLGPIKLSTQTRHASVDLTIKGEKGATTRSKTSQHRHGTAIDIKIPHKIETPQFTEYVETIFEIAYKTGFRAFGFGSNVVHIDVRDRYTWWRYPETKKDLTFSRTTGGAHTMDLLPHDALGFEQFLKKCGIGAAMKTYNRQLKKWRARKSVSGDIKSVLPENIASGTNKVLKEYILSNTPQQPKDVSIIEIIADEVNEVLNNLPEVKLASETLSEDELKDLFSPLAKQVVTKVRGQIEEEIKKLVVLEVNAAQLKDAVAQRVQTRGADSVTDAEKLELLSFYTRDELEAVGIELDVTDIEGIAEAEKI